MKNCNRTFSTYMVAANWMEQWMDYLKSGNIRPDYDAPGLPKARKALIYDKMPPGEKKITVITLIPYAYSRMPSMIAGPMAGSRDWP